MNRMLAVGVALLAAGAANAQGVLTELPRASNGRPDMSGVWQALNTAHWNLEPHVSAYPVVIELGAQFAVPPARVSSKAARFPICPRRARSATDISRIA